MEAQTIDNQSKVSSVWIIEDNDAYRRTTCTLLNECSDIACARTFASCEEAIEALQTGESPDVLLVDVALPGISGIDGIKQIKALAPEAQAVVLTVFDDDDKIFRAICAGASGYLLKTAGMDEIIASVRQAIAGGAPMSGRIAKRALQMFTRFAPKETSSQLTPKEKKVLELLAADYGKKQIADALEMSFYTVDAHLRHIYKKLQVHSSAGAVARALKDGLI
jgi:DNA-binding NarL/FixJ family response regulator